MQEVVELARRQHTGLAAVILYTKDIKDIHKVLLWIIRLILDRAHRLKESIDVTD